MARFVPNRPGINFILKAPGGPVYQHIENLSSQTASRAKMKVGVDTGALQTSIHYTMGFGRNGMPAGRIGSSNKIALLHHEGTSPHSIKPVNRKALRFKNHGKMVYATHVNHPGTKPNRYLTDSLREVI